MHGGGSTVKKTTSVMDINDWGISGSDYDTKSYTISLTGTGQYLYMVRGVRSNGYGSHSKIEWSGCDNVVQIPFPGGNGTEPFEMNGQYFDTFIGFFSNPNNPTISYTVGSTYTTIDIDIFKLG